ncbi:MAG: 50S ribosomal protein L6 [Candidatus Sungbacteria bacterium]|nr:50S ribosomal protein L6 [Candidatus Sungbacteria bacterium]
MSRIGKKPIAVPPEVTIALQDGNHVVVKGPKGQLARTLHPYIGLETGESMLTVLPIRQSKQTSALWGLERSLLANMVEGVYRGFAKKLEFEGIGYRASMDGNTLVMQLGFSHPVRFLAPEGTLLQVERNVITVSGIDKELIGQVAARIRALKPPEPYKGKGIRYQGEIIRRKAGKKATAGG